MTSNPNAVAASALLLGSSAGFLVGRATLGALGSLTLAERVGVVSTTILGAGGLLYSLRPTPSQPQSPSTDSQPTAEVAAPAAAPQTASTGAGAAAPAAAQPQRQGPPLRVFISDSAKQELQNLKMTPVSVIEAFEKAAPSWEVTQVSADEAASTTGRGLVIFHKPIGSRPQLAQQNVLIFGQKNDFAAGMDSLPEGVKRFGGNVIWCFVTADASIEQGFKRDLEREGSNGMPCDGRLWSGTDCEFDEEFTQTACGKGLALVAGSTPDKVTSSIAEAVEAIHASRSEQKRIRAARRHNG
jgi:hypothetical protein